MSEGREREEMASKSQVKSSQSISPAGRGEGGGPGVSKVEGEGRR